MAEKKNVIRKKDLLLIKMEIISSECLRQVLKKNIAICLIQILLQKLERFSLD